MNIIFHPEEETEFADAIAYYEECSLGLGIDFSRVISPTIQKLLEAPGLDIE